MARPRKATLTIINLSGGRQKTREAEVQISKSGIYIGPVVAKKLHLKKGDYVTLVEEEGTYYLGKRPPNVFGGGRLSTHDKSPDRPFVPLKNHKLKINTYTLGGEVDVELTDEQDKKVTAFCYELIPH